MTMMNIVMKLYLYFDFDIQIIHLSLFIFDGSLPNSVFHHLVSV